MKKIAIAFALLVGCNSQVFAAGDAAAGESKSVTCAACHGANGNSQVEIYPKIAGQHSNYIFKQLQQFKAAAMSGGKEGRHDPVMSGMAMPLSETDMHDLAAFYASQTMEMGATPESAVEIGEQLYRGGDPERGLPACLACHGPRGVGTSLSGFPRISGQHPAYTEAQLKKFRAGDRNNDMNGMMRDLAMKLTDAEIKALAGYLAGLH